MTIYLLHGWGADAELLRPMVQPLAQALGNDYCVILLNLPGYGYARSSAIPKNLIAMAHSVLTEMTAQFIVIGWSLGGLVALQLAELYPARVLKVILLASTPCFIANKTWPGISSKLFKEFEQVLSKDSQTARRRFVLMIANNIPRTHAAYLASCWQYTLENCRQAHLQRGLIILQKADLRKALAKLACSVQFIIGANDPLLTKNLAKCLQQLNARSEINCIAEAGHLLFLTHTDACVTRIKNFIHP